MTLVKVLMDAFLQHGYSGVIYGYQCKLCLGHSVGNFVVMVYALLLNPSLGLLPMSAHRVWIIDVQ